MRRRPLPLPLAAVLLLVAGLLVSCTAPALGPALRLAGGDGRPGTFTARHLECVQHPGHETCTWIGDFRSEDGAVRRAGVALAGSDRGTHQAGLPTEAIDVGLAGRVYGPAGSSEWIFTAILFLAAPALAAFVLAPVAGALRRRRALAREGHERDRRLPVARGADG
ncbi:hypothetical protein [Nonomuraea jiangxiensis]|uniref:Uncharacterized protein n=1 Tax=Nonomuraea jiangxiensis TaxID=633440 RepID=A0A1G8W9A7_9ACTN|nr:hypothetical protein [Nonomuraea jiangxiensis]SDJ74697.1 hypothetical protein SAMN05421869_11285 [Nonomuraea jiangxiensis]